MKNLEIEKYKKILEDEGFPIVYEWTDVPNFQYEKHAHKGRVSFFVVDGSVTFSGGIDKIVSKGGRIDVSPNVFHRAVVGSEGCTYVVGQEIEGDA